MKVRASLKALKQKPGSSVVRRHGRVLVINKKNPQWKSSTYLSTCRRCVVGAC